MKKIEVLFLIAFYIILYPFTVVVAQDCDCYNSTRSKGVSLMQQKQYSKAIEYFRAAEDCPDKPSSNDLQAKRNECLRAIKQIEEERQHEAELERKRAQEANYAAKGYMEITDIRFANTKKDGTIINDYGSTLYSSELRYLKPKLYYNGLASEKKTIKLFWKIYKGDGTLSRGSSSPEGYTSSSEYTIYPGNGNTINLLGWGNDDGGTYPVGTCRYELWYNGNCLFSKQVEINRKPGEASYLKVDNKTSVTKSFSENGGTETFYVSTDGDSWSTWGVPSFCKILEKTSTSFKLKCEPNTSSSERTDYLKIQAGNKEVRIDIKQDGKKGPSATINRVWVDHNIAKTGYNSVYNAYFGWQQVPTTIYVMRIHVDFDINGMKDKTIRVCAFFFDSNGNKMRSSNNQYKTVDGQVTVQDTGRPSYESSTWSDFILEIPYSVMKKGSDKFLVQIQDSNGTTFASSDYEYFSVN